MMSTTLSRTAARRLIRALPVSVSASKTTTYSSSSNVSKAVSMTALSNNNNSAMDMAASWTPPELKLCPASQQLPQQRRDFVWHAGFLQAQEAEELAHTIHQHMIELTEMIQALPKENVECEENMKVERILNQERMILKMCQDYQRLTGEEYEELPQPHCDESATVLRMA